MMQFRFDPNQEYQLRAIEAVADLFEGEPRHGDEITFTLGSLPAVPNRLLLTPEALLTNLSAVQQRNGIPPDGSLAFIDGQVDGPGGARPVGFPNFSIEMETGTGKTYVYTRTALELHRRYGMRKFIIVVPSVAIRQGVLKSFQQSLEQLRELYGRPPVRSYVYDSEDLTRVRQFALSPGVELMVMTIDSFNKASNVIRQSTDKLQGETPIHMVQAARPILILDEPQNMESELRIKALAALDPLFALRYSATHRNPYNLVYRLTPFEAYRQGLVKRIEVASVVREDAENLPYVRLDTITTVKRTITARLTVHRLLKSGAIKGGTVTVRPGDALATKTGRSEYSGFEVDEINPGGGFVRFSNGVEVRRGEALGADRDAIFRAQIAYTIEEHFRKQASLRPQGIKVLSLIFIDRVDNYANEDGIIRRLFVEEFRRIRSGYAQWQDVDPLTVQAAYFAQRKRRGGAVDLLDSVSGETKEDEAAYTLIMNDKERLLSLDEPVAFIFSHSALREGWDNPNVFQICTLNQTASEVKKRQEVGRGMRLARNQGGEQIKEERVNRLTVIANESYESYVARLQSEIEEEYGVSGTPPKPPDARKRTTAHVRKEFVLRPEFKELWSRIKHKTRYAVRIDTEKLLTDAVALLDAETVRPPRVTVTKALVEAGDEERFEAIRTTSGKATVDLSGTFSLPNLVDLMADLMTRTTPPVRLTRHTLLQVFARSALAQAGTANPQEFATVATRVLKEVLADHLVKGIKYERIDEWYEMSQFDADIEGWSEYLIPARRSLYDQVPFDSDIERQFIDGLERRDDVKLYVKLPSWFTVPTPVGEYNPDWAIVLEERDAHGQPVGESRLYLVRETKDADWKTNLRPDERRKIACGERHFVGELKVDYRVVTTAEELP